MRRLLLAAAAAVVAVAVLASAGAASLARGEYRRMVRGRHAARGEVELRIVNPARATVAVYRAGNTPRETVHVGYAAGETWLPEGRFFVEAALGTARMHFPVTLDGSGTGPDADGSWPVTIRTPAADVPPRLDPRVPPFVVIPGGYFLMGERQNPGQPHPVWVPAFHLAAFEVTNGEFRRFLADPHGFEDAANWTEAGWRWKKAGLSQPTARLTPGHPLYPRFGRDELPVVLVTWHEASAYCRWLTRRLGAGRWLFRMPTEGEWEKAARGPDSFDYGLGQALSEPEAPLYNWRKNPGAAVTLVGHQETRRDYAANRYGVYHASGNAREWTQSVFRHYTAADPYREDDRNAGDAPGMRVTRGGSWYSATATRLQLSYREEFQPELSSDDLGFRVAAILGAGEGPRD
jgi:formylglycine-generating enzyme required for sulfatase activity